MYGKKLLMKCRGSCADQSGVIYRMVRMRRNQFMGSLKVNNCDGGCVALSRLALTRGRVDDESSQTGDYPANKRGDLNTNTSVVGVGLVISVRYFPCSTEIGGPIRPECDEGGRVSCMWTRKFTINPNVGARRAREEWEKTRRSENTFQVLSPTPKTVDTKIYAINTHGQDASVRNVCDVYAGAPGSIKSMDNEITRDVAGPSVVSGTLDDVGGPYPETVGSGVEVKEVDRNNNHVVDAAVPGVSANVEEIDDLIRFSTDGTEAGEEATGDQYTSSKVGNDTGRRAASTEKSTAGGTTGDDEVFDWSEHVEEEERLREIEDRRMSEAEEEQAAWLRAREGEILEQIRWACRTSGAGVITTDQIRDKCINIGYSIHEFYICLENATADGHLEIEDEGKRIRQISGKDDIGKREIDEEKRREVRQMWTEATTPKTGKKKAGRPPGSKNKKFTKERASNRTREPGDLQRPLPLSFHQQTGKKMSVETSDDASGERGHGSSGSDYVGARKQSHTGITPLLPTLQMGSKRRPRSLQERKPALEWRRATCNEETNMMGPPTIQSNNTTVVMERTPGGGYDGGEDTSDGTGRVRERRRRSTHENTLHGSSRKDRSRSRIKTEPAEPNRKNALGRPVPIISLSDDECLREDDEEVEELHAESMEAEEISVIGPLPADGQPNPLPKNKQSSPKPQSQKARADSPGINKTGRPLCRRGLVGGPSLMGKMTRTTSKKKKKDTDVPVLPNVRDVIGRKR